MRLKYLARQGGDSSQAPLETTEAILAKAIVYLNENSYRQIHGLNEQVSIKDYRSVLQFYYAMLEQSASGKILVD